jgi:hypothetical protein
MLPRMKIPNSVMLVAVACLLGAGCERRPDVPGGAVEAAPAVTNAPPQPKPQFTRLVGRWERPDGGYVMQFRSVDADGKLDAGYFNPQPIHVERAQAVVEQDQTRVFVVLRDVNYPGCTYKLTYDSTADQLFGQYYQASMQQTYDVTFARLKQ